MLFENSFLLKSPKNGPSVELLLLEWPYGGKQTEKLLQISKHRMNTEQQVLP